MSEREALLQGIYQNPDDDTRRLVFADWLDEHGEGPWAELIRTQVQQCLAPCAGPLRKLFSSPAERGAAVDERARQHLQDMGGIRWRVSPSANALEIEKGFPVEFRLAWWEMDQGHALSDYLRALPTVRRLCLRLEQTLSDHTDDPQTRMYTPTFEDLLVCPELKQLTDLSLPSAHLGEGELSRLLAALSIRAPALHRLDLTSVDLTSNMGRMLAEQLPPGVTELGLTQTLHRPQNASAAAPIIELLTSGTRTWRALHFDGWPLARTLEHLCTLGGMEGIEDMRLGRNQIGPDTLPIILMSPRLHHLRVLDLSYNPLAREGIEVLARYAPQQLQEINLLGTAAIETVNAGFAHRLLQRCPSLQFLLLKAKHERAIPCDAHAIFTEHIGPGNGNGAYFPTARA
jgi:uncharacterized protein (TIGR02996 family)